MVSLSNNSIPCDTWAKSIETTVAQAVATMKEISTYSILRPPPLPLPHCRHCRRSPEKTRKTKGHQHSASNTPIYVQRPLLTSSPSLVVVEDFTSMALISSVSNRSLPSNRSTPFFPSLPSLDSPLPPLPPLVVSFFLAN